MKFIITEEEKNRIRGLYEYVDESDTFLDQFSRIYRVPMEDAESINFSSGQTQMDIVKNTLMGPLKIPTIEHAREKGRLDRLLQELLSFYKGDTGLKGSVSEEQKLWLNDFIEILKVIKPQIENYAQGLPQEKVSVKVGDPNYLPSTEVLQSVKSGLDRYSQGLPQEKINTTNDSTYDYKLSDDKYYYSLKGQNNWVEANGKGLESIKSKVTFS